MDIGFDPAEMAFGAKPLEWSCHDEKEGLTWRILRAEDMPEVFDLWHGMDIRLGAAQDKPNQFKMPVVLTLVAVDDATGRIVSALYGEAVVDFTMIGMSRRAARSIQAVIPYIELNLWARAIRITRVLVPKRMRRHMKRMLPGFTDITDCYAQFTRKIRD